MRFFQDTDQRPASRSGSGVIELLVAVALMSVVLGIAAHLGTTIVRYRANVDRQRAATEAADNLMEVVLSMPYERINDQNLSRLANTIAEGSWKIDVEELSHNELPAKRVRAQISTAPASKLDQLRKPLVVWRYASERSAEDEQP